MLGKTLTDGEMMIFAYSFAVNNEKLSQHVGITRKERVRMAFERAVSDAVAIRKNADHIEEKLSRFEEYKTELEVLKKILGLPPDE